MNSEILFKNEVCEQFCLSSKKNVDNVVWLLFVRFLKKNKKTEKILMKINVQKWETTSKLVENNNHNINYKVWNFHIHM